MFDPLGVEQTDLIQNELSNIIHVVKWKGQWCFLVHFELVRIIHIDASQWMGKVSIDVSRLSVDLLTDNFMSRKELIRQDVWY